MVPVLSSTNPCQGPITKKPSHESLLAKLNERAGRTFGPQWHTSVACPPPCRQVRVKSTFFSAFANKHADNYVVFSYQSSVTKTTVQPSYGLANLLVEVGSCLGLWLGVSVVGLYDIAVLGVPRFSARFKQALASEPDL